MFSEVVVEYNGFEEVVIDIGKVAAVAVADTDVVSWPPRMPVADEKDSAAGDCGTDVLPAEAAELEAAVAAALPCKMELNERTEELETRLDLVCCCAFSERNCGVEAPVVWDGGVASGLLLKLAGADSLSWRSWPVESRKLRALRGKVIDGGGMDMLALCVTLLVMSSSRW